MPSGILKFDLETEADQHKMAVNGHLWGCAMQALDERLRNGIKRGGGSAETKHAFEMVRDFLREELNGLGLSLEDIP